MTREVIATSQLRERVTVGHLSVLSRWPLEELRQPALLLGTPALRLRVERPGAPFVLHAIHAPNPLYQTTFEDQERLAKALVRVMEAEAVPAVVVGDLNLTDRAEGYRVLEASMRDAMRAGSWPADTYRLHLWRSCCSGSTTCSCRTAGALPIPSPSTCRGRIDRGIEATVGPCP